MIVHDTPVAYSEKYGPSAHLCSTLVGDEGKEELIAFAQGIGLKVQWIQKEDQPTEHFDIFKGKLAAAKKAGAVLVNRDQIVAVWDRKRHHLGRPMIVFKTLDECIETIGTIAPFQSGRQTGMAL